MLRLILKDTYLMSKSYSYIPGSCLDPHVEIIAHVCNAQSASLLTLKPNSNLGDTMITWNINKKELKMNEFY